MGREVVDLQTCRSVPAAHYVRLAQYIKLIKEAQFFHSLLFFYSYTSCRNVPLPAPQKQMLEQYLEWRVG